MNLAILLPEESDESRREPRIIPGPLGLAYVSTVAICRKLACCLAGADPIRLLFS